MVTPADVIKQSLGTSSDAWHRFVILSSRFPFRVQLELKRKFDGRSSRWWQDAAMSAVRRKLIAWDVIDIVCALERELMDARGWIDA